MPSILKYHRGMVNCILVVVVVAAGRVLAVVEIEAFHHPR